ncbi:hypothetical protein F7725_008785 [Dissostichus mawsoni]|uniref:G-protein coupled receptors family 1 profile domain-containing protein n=1 Tax=Dissostichus mawsoni TaxID=36200 RepID=A0A7J5Y842_DISMA|nr:hypothetical protein F7725_008785 [Dissostichus mawsoni]
MVREVVLDFMTMEAARANANGDAPERGFRNRNLRSDTLILTLSCCFSDITLSLSAFPLAVYHAVSHPPGPPPSDGVLCQGGGFLLLLLQTSSLYSLFWTSVDTFVDICFALIYSMIVTPGRCRLVLLMMWSGCLGGAALPLMGFGHYTYREDRYLCGPDFSPAHTAFVMLWLVGVFVPLIAMVSLYGHVVIVARKQTRRGTFICNEINCHYVPVNIYLRSSIAMLSTSESISDLSSLHLAGSEQHRPEPLDHLPDPEVQGSSASQSAQVCAGVCGGGAAGVPPPELRPQAGSSQSDQHNDDNYNTTPVITNNTRTALVPHHHAGPLSGRTPQEGHDAGPCVREATSESLPLSDGPGVSLQLPQQVRELLGAQVLGPPEHVALGDAFRALQLVHLHHASEGDEPHQRGGGQQRERHLEALLQSLQGVQHCSACGPAAEHRFILDGGQGVQHCSACGPAAEHRFILDGGQVFSLSQGGQQRRQRTTSRVASRRDEGQTFQLSRTPSRSSF